MSDLAEKFQKLGFTASPEKDPSPKKPEQKPKEPEIKLKASDIVTFTGSKDGISLWRGPSGRIGIGDLSNFNLESQFKVLNPNVENSGTAIIQPLGQDPNDETSYQVKLTSLKISAQ